MNIRFFRFLWFMSLGIGRSYFPEGLQRGSSDVVFELSEPSGSIICRRNILALSSTIVLAGAAGIDPYDFSILGLQVPEGRGIWVLGAAAIFAHLYWYSMRYQHLTGEKTVLRTDTSGAPAGKPATKFTIVRKTADLWANRAAAILTLVSWIFVGLWICGPDA